jgi:putative metallohydrolase (TIGR04338 family)
VSRDVQRQRAYNGEFAMRDMLDVARKHECSTVEIAGTVLNAPQERVFGDLESIQRYVNKVLALNWVRATWDAAHQPISIRRRKGTTKAHYRLGEIAIPDQVGWAMREIVVLHEVAHHLARGAGHGPRFVGTFVALVTEILGEEAGFMLRVCMLDCGAQEEPVKILCRTH